MVSATGEQRTITLDDSGELTGVVMAIDPALEDTQPLCGRDKTVCEALGHTHGRSKTFAEAVVAAALENAADRKR